MPGVFTSSGIFLPFLLSSRKVFIWGLLLFAVIPEDFAPRMVRDSVVACKNSKRRIPEPCGPQNTRE